MTDEKVKPKSDCDTCAHEYRRDGLLRHFEKKQGADE